MIKAINAGDKNELRKLLKMYSQPIYQRALAKVGSTDAAKEITRSVLMHVTSCAAIGTCREDADSWLMSVTDTQIDRYIADAQAAEAVSKQKESYFTAPTVAGNAPSTDAYAANHAPIYENEQAAPIQEDDSAFVPFSPTLTIPERPEFTERHDASYNAQPRTAQPQAPQFTVPPIQTSTQFTPPQYVPPQYTPPAESSVMEEIKNDTTVRTQYSEFNQTAMHNTQANSEPVITESNDPDNIIPITLHNDAEIEREIKGSNASKKQKKKGSFFNNGVLIAVISIILMLVVGFLIAEIVSILV